MPYLTIGHYKRKQDSQEASPSPDESVHDEPKTFGGRDEAVINRNSKQIVHEIMTLDQYYYSTILDTDERDRDQVLSKFLDKQRAKKPPGLDRLKDNKHVAPITGATGGSDVERHILVVGQLWIWVIDEST